MRTPNHLVRELEADARAAADLLRVLANEHRLLVLCALRTGELSVGQLAERVGLSQSALSQHLARLRSDRIVSTRRQGQTIFYGIADPDALSLVEALAGVMQRRREGR
ncbi:MAG: ArsR/SmtB family transcription factor [Phenylobacterium sp.]|uniref:ArsR/SmtB family transcription factor n=1 Tax=Phenylobacterium sp. TaxID=1871053 RepID=UPI003919D4F3